MERTNLNTHASASAIAKILGIEFAKGKDFKTFLEDSPLETVEKSYVIKNKTVDFDAYNIMEAVSYALKHIEGDHIKEVSIDIGDV